jgi:hypothetical protein
MLLLRLAVAVCRCAEADEMLHRAFCGNAAFRGCKTGSHRRGFWEYDMAGAAADV